jgi:capsular polysaccharide biosynthesis protein
MWAARFARNAASREKGVWRGWLVTPAILLFWFLQRALGSDAWRRRFVSLPMPSTDGWVDSGELLPRDVAFAADPITFDSDPAPRPSNEAELGPISWRLHRGVLLPVGRSARRTAWINGSRLVVEHSEVEVFDFRQFSAHLDLIAACRFGGVARKHGPEEFLDAAIYPGSFAPGNWYHWMTETLPRIWLADRLPAAFDDVPLLIHRGFLDVPAIRETLDLVRGDRPVRTAEDVGWLHIERMVWIDGMFSMKHHSMYPDGSIDQSSRFHPAMKEYRSALLHSRPPTEGRTPRRVFLDRGNSVRRYNDQEVKEALASRGFVAVEAGSLDFAGQVELFANAEALVGPSGAAWANLLFASEGARALYWTPEYFAGTQIWSSLASLSGTVVHEHTYPQEFGTYKSGHYTIDVPRLLADVDRVLESTE